MISAKVVIAVPFFNEIQFIEETLSCLKSIPQTDGDIKFFLCDNKSTDGSREIAEKYAKADDRFVLYSHDENIGAIQNFQFAFERSDSDYFMWLGAHDLIDPSYPKAAIEAFDQHHAISYAAAEPYGFRKKTSRCKRMKNSQYLKLSKNRLTRYVQSVERISNCTIVNSLFRRSFAKDFMFRSTISWDHVFISHLLWYGPLFYTKGQKYYRRLFDNTAQTRESKLLSKEVQAAQLHYSKFIELYVDDFQRLYRGPKQCQAHICHQIFNILEKRFGLSAFDYPNGPSLQSE